MPLMYFSDLTLIKAQCNLDTSFVADDTLLTLFENEAVVHAQNRTRRYLTATALTEELDEFPAGAIPLAANLNSVTSIKYFTDASVSEQTLATNQYEVKTKPLVGFVRPARYCYWPAGAYKITIAYNAGYGTGSGQTPVPAPIQAWLLAAIATKYANREIAMIGQGQVQAVELPSKIFDDLLDMYAVPVVP
jgi:hypothetical protein